MTIEEVLEDFPRITKEDIKAALKYAAKLVKDKIKVLARAQ